MFVCRHCHCISAEAGLGEDGVRRCQFCNSPEDCAPGVKTEKSSVPQYKQPLPAGFGFATPNVENVDKDEYLGEVTLHYPLCLDIPGTPYCHVLPCQSEVSRGIVKAKMEELRRNHGMIVLDVCRAADKNEVSTGRLVLADDGHHTFVAALRLGRPVTLRLLRGEWVADHQSWAGCKYSDAF